MPIITVRSCLTSGIAALGVGAIALSPIQLLPNQTSPAQERVVGNLAVNLASTIDPITPWVNTLQSAAQNIATLANFYAVQPLPIAQTVWANLGTYLDEAMSGNAGLIPEQMSNNVTTFFQAPWWNKDGAPIVNDELASQYVSRTEIGLLLGKAKIGQNFIYGSLPSKLTPEQLAQLTPVLEFLATPYSGQLAGALSPAIGSVVALTRSFTAVGKFFQDGDVVGAINELINIPANVTNAQLNGAGFLDLTSVLGGLLPLPPDLLVLKSGGLNLGGLLSPPVPYNGSQFTPDTNPVTELTGGTFFDSVALDLVDPDGEPAIQTPGLTPSFAGSVIGLGQFLGKNMLVTPPPPASAAAAEAEAAADAVTVESEIADVVDVSAPVVSRAGNAAADDSATAGDSDAGQSGGKRPTRAGGRG